MLIDCLKKIKGFTPEEVEEMTSAYTSAVEGGASKYEASIEAVTGYHKGLVEQFKVIRPVRYKAPKKPPYTIPDDGVIRIGSIAAGKTTRLAATIVAYLEKDGFTVLSVSRSNTSNSRYVNVAPEHEHDWPIVIRVSDHRPGHLRSYPIDIRLGDDVSNIALRLKNYIKESNKLDKQFREQQERDRILRGSILRQVPDENFGQSAYTFKESDYRPSIVEWAKEKFGDRVAPNGKPVYQNFVRFFGNSQVVNEKDDPLEVFHWTTENFDAFEQSQIGRNASTVLEGFFFADVPGGSGRTEGSNVMPVYLSIQNPVYLDVAKSDFDTVGAQEAIQHFVQNGTTDYLEQYLRDSEGLNESQVERVLSKWETADGAILTNTQYANHSTEYVAFTPTQIKSAIGNTGDFSPEEGSILRQVPNSPFYSRVESIIKDKMPARASAAQVTALLAKNGVKELDPEFQALKVWLPERVSKEDVLAFVEANKVVVSEVVKGSNLDNKDIDILRKAGIEVERNEDDPDSPLGFFLDGDFIDSAEAKEAVKNGEITQEVADAIKRLEDADDNSSKTKFDQWQLPGESENYREEFLTAPAQGEQFDPAKVARKVFDRGDTHNKYSSRTGNWQDGHSDYDDVVNPIVRIRYNDRTISAAAMSEKEAIAFAEKHARTSNPDSVGSGAFIGVDPEEVTRFKSFVAQQRVNEGRRPVWDANEKMLFAEEIQQPSKDNLAKMPKVYSKFGEEMAIRKMLYRAVEGGYDWFGFTTGQQQADRYDLSKKVDWIDSEKDGEYRDVEIKITNSDTIDLRIDVNGQIVGVRDPAGEFSNLKHKPLADAVGKDIAKQILESNTLHLAGADLKIGGEGLIARYDRKHVDYINKLMKPYGVRVEAKEIRTVADSSGTTWKDARVVPETLENGTETGGYEVFATRKDNGKEHRIGTFDSKVEAEAEAAYVTGNGKTETIHAARISPEFKAAVKAAMRDHGGAFPLFKQPENRADLNELKTKYLDELAPDVKTEYKGDNVVEINAEASEVIRTALAAVQDTKREAQAVVGSLFTEPQNAAGLIEAIDEIGIVLDENGIDTKQVKALVKNIEKASDKDGTVIFDGGGFKHEEDHYASWKGAARKELSVRYHNLKSLVSDKLFSTAFNGWVKLEGRNWKADNASPVQLGHAAEEIARYIADGDHARLGLTEREGDKLAVELGLRYAQARIEENPDLTVAQALATFDGTNTGQYIEAINNEATRQSNEGDVQSEGLGQDQEYQGRDASDEAGDGEGVSGSETFTPGGPERLSKTPSTLNKGGIPAQQRLYTSTTNEERQAFANERMDEGVDEAQKWVEDQIRTNNNNAGATGVVGINVMMQLGKEGRIDELNKFADDLLPQITDAAQMVQAVSIVSMFSPETAGVYVTKVAKKNGKDVTPEQVKKTVEIAQNMSEIVKTDGLIEAELEKAEALNKQYAQDVKDLEAALGIMTDRAEMAEADAKKFKGKLSGMGRTIASLKRKLEGTVKPKVARDVAKKAKDIAERRSEIIDAIVAKYGANPVLRMVAPTSEGVFRQVPPTDNTAEIEWTIDQLINQKALTEKTPEQVKDALNTVTNGGLTEAQIDEIYAQAVSEIQVKREALDDEHKAAQKARNAHYRASRQHYDAITEKYFPKTKVEGMEKVVAAIIRVGVEGGFSDEAIWLTLYRRAEPDVNKQLKAFREEFPDVENERHVLAESAKLKQLATDRVNADRAQAKNDWKLTEDDIKLVKEEKRVNNAAKQELVRNANRFYEGMVKGNTETIIDFIVQFRRANLLSAIKSHFVNIGGNIGKAVGEEIARYPASVADALASIYTKERTVAPSQSGVLAGLKTLVSQDDTLKNAKWDSPEGKQAAMNAAHHVLKYGGSPEDMERLQHSETVLSEKFPITKKTVRVGKYDVPLSPTKWADNYIQLVFKTLGAEDAFFKVYAFSRHIREQARAIALTEHRRDKSVNVKERMAELVKNPTNAMQVMADRYAHLMTWQNPNPFSNAMAYVKRMHWGVKNVAETFVPYDKTPTNIVIDMLQYSPMGVPMAVGHIARRTPTREFRNALTGPIRKDMDATEEFKKMDAIEQRQVVEATLKHLYSRQQQERFAKTLGRAATGTGAGFTLGFVMAAAGLATGAMFYDDDDKKESKEVARRKAEGIDNGSIYTPFGRVTLPKSPLTASFTAGATFYEQMVMSKKSPVLSAMNAGAESFSDIISEQPLISSTTNTIRPLWKGKFGEFGGNLLSGYVPASAMVRAVSEVGDPVERTGSGYQKGEKLKSFDKWLAFQGRGFRNSFLKGIPVARNYLVDPSTNPSPGRGGIFRRMVRTFDPFNTRPVNSYSPPPGKVGVDNYLKSSEFKSASTDDLVDALMNEEYDSSDKAKMQNALKQKARNARKSKTLTQEEVDRIKKVLPEFNITAREKKR